MDAGFTTGFGVGAGLVAVFLFELGLGFDAGLTYFVPLLLGVGCTGFVTTGFTGACVVLGVVTATGFGLDGGVFFAAGLAGSLCAVVSL